MAPLLVIFAIVALLVPSGAAVFTPGTIGNKLIVRYQFAADITHQKSFYILPRTQHEAQKDSYQQVGPLRPDHTTRWCRDGEYSVCLLFDRQGSVAGIEISVSIADVKKFKLPFNLSASPEWKRQTIFDTPVLSTTTYFVRKDVLAKGGRRLTEKTLTAPEGIFFLQTDRKGSEKQQVHLTVKEADAKRVGFSKQACFPAQGIHYTQGLSATSKSCSEMGTYAGLYNKSHELHGFVFHAFGREPKPRITGGRRYFESGGSSYILRLSIPNAPQCLFDWNDKFGLFFLHVYFIDKPYYLTC